MVVNKAAVVEWLQAIDMILLYVFENDVLAVHGMGYIYAVFCILRIVIGCTIAKCRNIYSSIVV